MEETAKDLLIKGLKNRDLQKDIIKNPAWFFGEAYVRDMAATEEVLDLDKGSTEVEVNVMQVKNEYAQKQHRLKGDYWMERRCYSCGMTGHLRKDCHMNTRGTSYNSQSYRHEGRHNDRYRNYGYQNYRKPNAEPGNRNRFPREPDRRYNQHHPHFNAMNNNNRYSHQTPHAHPRPSSDSATPREFRPQETSRKVYSVQQPAPCQEEVKEHASLDPPYPDLEMYQLICNEDEDEKEAQGNRISPGVLNRLSDEDALEEKSSTVTMCEGSVYVTCKINGVSILALIDTGSAVNILKEGFLANLKLGKEKAAS